MLKANERLCKCGCGQIINIKKDSYIIKENSKRKSYYVSKRHLSKKNQQILSYLIESKTIKEIIKGGEII